MSSTTGTVRSALANPPGPVVSWPSSPNRPGSVSSTSRACWPPTRSWTSTATAPSTADSSEVVVTSRPGNLLCGQDPPGQAADDLEPVGGDVVQHQLVDREHAGPAGEPLDQLGCVRAAATDDRDLHRPASTRPATWQAALCPGASSRGSGVTVEHCVDRQRAAAAEPAALARVDHLRRLASVGRLHDASGARGSGTADSSSCVYGCFGSASTSSVGPDSTMCPAYMTISRSETYRALAMSWVM